MEKSGCSSSKGRTSSRLHSSLVSNLTAFRHDCINIIVGAKNLHCPVKVPHRYNVLGLYHVTDVWSETVKGKVVCRARFEMIDLKTPSWCGVKGSPQPTITPDFITKAPRETCHVCGTSSKQVFEAGWTCLNETCTNFSTNHNVHQGTRAWNPAFMNERNEWPEYIKPPMPLKPLHQRRRSRRPASQLQRGSAKLGIQEPRPPKRDLL